MRSKSVSRTVLAAVAVGGLILPTAAMAAGTPADEDQRDRVRWRAQSDPRWEVRSAAGAALTSSSPTAIPDFLLTGIPAAERRATTDERNNVTQITLALRTSPSASLTHLASDRALHATHDEKDAFIRFGLAEARRLDAEGAGQHEGEVARQAAEDRAYVAQLAVTDPGAQVRSAASFAANSGRDEDLAEFFSYYWAAGARLDDEAYRLKLADLDSKGHAALDRLRAAALAAQAAEEAAGGEAAEKLHAETVAAWEAVADSAGGTSIDWAAERDRAAAEAEAWGQVAGYATAATTEQDWAGALARAGDSLAAWNAAAAEAADQSVFWQIQADEARDRANGTGGDE